MSHVNATSACEMREVLLQVVPVKVISDDGHSLTTYALLDSGSDITMIDPSLAMLLGLRGRPSKLRFNTASDCNAQQSGVKVDFKLASVSGTNETPVYVKSAWATKELTIPLKHNKVLKSTDQWPHLREVPFPISPNRNQCARSVRTRRSEKRK